MQTNISTEIEAPQQTAVPVSVPFFRPHLGEEEMAEVASTLRGGWLTTGPRVTEFEKEFARAVNGKYAVAVNSCTAALHLAVEAIGLREGHAVLIPTMTFAATAEIVLYKKAVPVLVDCDPVTGNMDLADAERKIEKLKQKSLPFLHGRDLKVVGMIPVHVGGYMLDVDKVKQFARKHGLWIIEDAAHAFPSAWRPSPTSPWRYCGDNTSSVTCFSFYANKTITTGEGGMAVTNDKAIADKIRLMSLHGLSHDAWERYSGGGWDYRIVQPGYKYNMTDIAAAIGLRQLDRAEEMRKQREAVAEYFLSALADVREIELPAEHENRLHSWHLFPIRLNLHQLQIDRNEFINELKDNKVGTSVHWRPLHKHPLYMERLGWRDDHFPSATKLWSEIISLPIFSSMTLEEMTHVVETVKSVCSRFAVSKTAAASNS
ncbi:MAG: DegT/DnrJ/EryC1/StrS family aminotransferase [Acidobacteriota bacterium]|nr:MAG: DegT/DnrJ/EryC1/StrS family aminotransferase [Acidobacteriota bacterium]